MNKETKDNINADYKKKLGMTYDEFALLDFDDQQKLLADYHKKHPDKSKDTYVMIGGGDESIIIRAKKGEKILTPNGYITAGETIEENRKKWEQELEESDKRLKKLNARLEKEIKKSTKLDFKTWLFLYITHVIRTDHPPVVEVEDKRTMYVKDTKKNEVFVFRNYEEYKNYFLMYLNNVDESIIDLAIYTHGSKGQIVAFKRLCEHIIVKQKVNEFYSSITQEQIDEIHSKGKLTPLEAVQLWESYDLCIEGNKTLICKNKCDFFNGNCHDCLMEEASHKLEHDNIELKLVNKHQ